MAFPSLEQVTVGKVTQTAPALMLLLGVRL
jgi:hypothetical protein